MSAFSERPNTQKIQHVLISGLIELSRFLVMIILSSVRDANFSDQRECKLKTVFERQAPLDCQFCMDVYVFTYNMLIAYGNYHRVCHRPYDVLKPGFSLSRILGIGILFGNRCKELHYVETFEVFFCISKRG